MDVKEVIKKVVEGDNLSGSEMTLVFRDIMTGKVTSSQIAALLTALRVKGETDEEITAAALVMRKKSLIIKTPPGDIVDTCGTGGSGKSTFNFSTASALVVSACGVRVAKHGNRSASGKCGSADVLEHLGVKLDVSPSLTEKCLREIGICFLYAPIFHESMKYALVPRKEIGIRTIFNLLGPLCNPATPNCQVVAVYDDKLTRVIAKALGNLGLKRAFVVSGEDGLDEVTLTGRTRVSELSNSRIKTYWMQPSDFGFKKTTFKKIAGGCPKTNSSIMTSILSGGRGPFRDMTVMNSALALLSVSKARGLRKAVTMAEDAIDSGRALEKLSLLCRMTNGTGCKTRVK